MKNSCAVILAGGQSSRAETIKGLRRINDRYWIDDQIRRLNGCGFSKIIVGLGYHHESYLEKSELLKSVDVVINPNPENGPFSTLKSVLQSIESSTKAIILFHIDRPIPKKTTLEKIVFSENIDIIKLQHKGKTGHPIGLLAPFWKSLLNQPELRNLREIIQSHDFNRIKYVSVEDEIILRNLNTEKEWNFFKNGIKP